MCLISPSDLLTIEIVGGKIVPRPFNYLPSRSKFHSRPALAYRGPAMPDSHFLIEEREEVETGVGVSVSVGECRKDEGTRGYATNVFSSESTAS